MRTVDLRLIETERRSDGLRRDFVMAARAACSAATAYARVCERDVVGLSVGRFHRMPPAGGRLGRRLSGGRVVVDGPGITQLTVVAPSADWFDAAGARIRPDQVLNRALRPLLGALRSLGVDAFYGGRDVVTVEGAVLAVAGFCPFPDGVVAVEVFLARARRFDERRGLAERIDPGGVMALDHTAFARTVSLAELGLDASLHDLFGRLRTAMEHEWRVRLAAGSPSAQSFERKANVASREALEAFQRERGPQPPGAVLVAEPAMLGVVEASAHVHDGRLRTLTISGDLIAPHGVLDTIEAGCEGTPLERESLARRVRAALRAPGAYVLGCRALDLLVARLAEAAPIDE